MGRTRIPAYLRTVLLTLAVAVGCQADPVSYTFHFQQMPPAQNIPTGSFTYDAATGQFSAFQVILNSVIFDFTANANTLGGNRRIPFELGFLAQNLISGTGIGPTLWFADDNGFRGFQWRTPAADFLAYSFSPVVGAPTWEDLGDGPNSRSGTWTTTVTPLATPEPGTLALMTSAGLAGLVIRRRRSK